MSYLSATRHPWAGLLFVVPLLAVYEFGVIRLGGDDPTALRNGADVWLRWGLERYGIDQIWVPAAVVIAVLLVRSMAAWTERPADTLTTWFGMTLESVVFGIGLWAVARNFEPLMRAWGLPVDAPAASIQFHTPAAGQLVTYIGAGIYEEVLFRLGLFSIVYFLLRVVLIPRPVAMAVAAVGAAGAFAAAHHIGPNGEEMESVRFLFRVLAGLYFTFLYVARGFGIAVGAHAGYDILVGLDVG